VAENSKQIKLADRRHPYYEDNVDMWEMYYDAVKGGDNFVNDSYLFSHMLEDEDSYDDRLSRAYYLNFCETVVNIYNFYIFRENIERPPDQRLIDFRKNANGRGDHISKVIRDIGYWSLVYGVVHVLVDVPRVGNGKRISRRDAKKKGIHPYCKLIYPTRLVDWSVDDVGKFNWVLIKEDYFDDSDPFKERSTYKHYRLITKEMWRVEDEDGNLVKYPDGSPAEGENKLGIVPVITVYHRESDKDKIGESLLKDIVYVNRAIMNWCSCIDEQIERHTFSQLVVPDAGELAEAQETGDDPLYKIGTSTIWTFPANANHPPRFISPDTTNIRTIWNLILDHAKEIFRMAGLLGSTGDLYVSRSGRAAQIGFQGVNAALAEKASTYQMCENEISKLVLMYLDEDVESYEEVKYPSTFDVASLSEEIDSLFRVMEKNFSATLNKMIQKNIARRAVPLAPESIRKQIEDEIDSSSGVVEQTKRERKGSTEDGNPNTNLGETFRSYEDVYREEVQHRTSEKEQE